MYKPLFEQTNPRTNLDKIIRIRDFDSGRLTKFEFFPKVLCARYVIFAIFLVFCIWVSASGVGLGGKSLKHTCSGKQLSTEEPTFEVHACPRFPADLRCMVSQAHDMILGA